MSDFDSKKKKYLVMHCEIIRHNVDPETNIPESTSFGNNMQHLCESEKALQDCLIKWGEHNHMIQWIWETSPEIYCKHMEKDYGLPVEDD